jgi:hypothetical protein
MEVFWDRLRDTSSRPYGTFRLSNLYPGLRPGLSSAVPAGLILQSPAFHAQTNALAETSSSALQSRWILSAGSALAKRLLCSRMVGIKSEGWI